MGKYTRDSNSSSAVEGDIDGAVRLFHRRWSVPIIGVLAQAGGMRFTDLNARLRASRDTLSETLKHLVECGIADRAEDGLYRLTPAGQELSKAAEPLVRMIPAAGLLDIALKKWPMLVVVVIGRGAERYSEIKQRLPGITSGALAPALKDLEAAGLVTRTIDRAYPPAPSYWLTAQAKELFPALNVLVKAAGVAVERTGG